MNILAYSKLKLHYSGYVKFIHCNITVMKRFLYLCFLSLIPFYARGNDAETPAGIGATAEHVNCLEAEHGKL
ncbi:hypothetical protein [Dyadobacter sp. 676]|uniref:Uncharacterized protein n=1 Tax=Dyadobacter sp. 676 TaxID=3088362 RepID=A0AAU8FER4_9BACT